MTQIAHRRIRVAVVAPTLQILGGHSIQADRLLRAWQHDPDVDAWLVPINPEAPGALRVLQRRKYVRTIVTQLTYWPRLLRELPNADIVHVFSASYFSFLLSPVPAVTIGRLFGKPILLNYHSGEAPDHLQRSTFARRVLGRVDLNVVPSRFLRDVFARFGIASRIIPNLVDLERFRYRERLPLRPRLVSTRNFEPLYDVACTLRAFQIVQARWPEASLTLVGRGSQDAHLRALSGKLGVRNVAFRGAVPPDQMADVYAEADLYIQTPEIDNMPVSMLEAFASGTPVVSTRAGGVPAILTDGEHGLLGPVGDHEAIARAVLRLLGDPELASRLARQAHAACRAYTWEATREQWLHAYRSVLRKPQRAAAPVHAQ